MEAEVQNHDDETGKPNEAEAPQVDPVALQEKIKALESTLERVESESKKHANKYRSLRDSIDQEKKQELEQSENWQKRFEMERETNEKLKNDFDSLKENTLYQNLNFEVAKYAPDARKIERVVSAVLDGKSLTVSEDGMRFDGVKEAIEFLRNEEDYLFKNERPASMVNKNPSGKAPQSKSVSEMSKSEREQLFKENISQMLKQQTRR